MSDKVVIDLLSDTDSEEDRTNQVYGSLRSSQTSTSRSQIPHDNSQHSSHHNTLAELGISSSPVNLTRPQSHVQMTGSLFHARGVPATHDTSKVVDLTYDESDPDDAAGIYGLEKSRSMPYFPTQSEHSHLRTTVSKPTAWTNYPPYTRLKSSYQHAANGLVTARIAAHNFVSSSQGSVAHDLLLASLSQIENFLSITSTRISRAMGLLESTLRSRMVLLRDPAALVPTSPASYNLRAISTSLANCERSLHYELEKAHSISSYIRQQQSSISATNWKKFVEMKDSLYRRFFQTRIEYEISDDSGESANEEDSPKPLFVNFHSPPLANVPQTTSPRPYVSLFSRPQPHSANDLQSLNRDPRASVDLDSKKIKQLIDNIQVHEEIPPEDRKGTPDDLEVNLMEHQKVGLTWLQKMEDNTHGGILADDMGLGKTVQAIALIVSRKAQTNDRVKTNLIIAPVALLRQWEKELRVKIKQNRRLSVHVHHGASSVSSNLSTLSGSRGHIRTFEDLACYDVVITTYGMIANEFKSVSEQPNSNNYSKKIFFHPQAVFHRIILDEAQQIKNSNTLSSKAVANLKSRFRWCLSGTPMQNRVEELYGLLRFLKIEPYCQERHFKREIAFGLKNNSEASLRKLQALLRAVCLRRTKKSTIDGKSILQLPEKRVKVDSLTLNKAEREFYDAVQKRMTRKINQFIAEGQVTKNYAHVLAMLLRLRQACCHPKLLIHAKLDSSDSRTDDSDFYSASSAFAEPDSVRAARRLSSEGVSRILQMHDFECPQCLDAVDRPDIQILVPCAHVMCRECASDLLGVSGDPDYQDQYSRVCPLCDKSVEQQYIGFETFELVFIKRLGDVELSLAHERSRLNRQQPGRPKIGSKPYKFSADSCPHLQSGPESCEAAIRRLNMSSLFPTGWVSSAKVNRCVDLVKEIWDVHPEDKIIVFSQFVGFLDLVHVPLIAQGVDLLRYDGSMTSSERNEVVTLFMENPQFKILLVSLKAGNVGLTLTSANHVILLDPFWNPYVEEQAMDRSHRIGQSKDVTVYKLIVADTVEDRIVELQKQKKELIDNALDEGGLKQISKLQTKELLYLFGMR